MNLVVLVGNLTQDPEVRYASNGNPIANLNIAVNKTFKREGEPDADFFRVTVFGKQAELVEKYLSKGRKVGIEGRIQNDNYENKEGQKVYRDSIIANRIEFLSPKGEGGGSGGGGWNQQAGGQGGQRSQGGQAGGGQDAFGGQFGGPGSAQGGGQAPAASVPGGFAELEDDDDDLPF
jgi:single-strand DNA-binding protein